MITTFSDQRWLILVHLNAAFDAQITFAVHLNAAFDAQITFQYI
jgi:hypothetical protein